MSRALAVSGLLLAALAAVLTSPAGARPDGQALLASAKARLAARDYGKAREELARVTGEGDAALADEARLLLARAFLLEGRHDEAARAARALQSPSPLAAQARYVEAAALLRAGRAAEAGRLVEERALTLSSPARRAELAQGWRALGDEAWGATPPDLRRALDAYGRALALGPEALGGGLGELLVRQGECLQRLSRHEDAVAAFNAARAPRARLADPARALLLEAESLLALGRAEGARLLLKQVQTDHAASPEAPLAAERLGDSWRPAAPDAPARARELGMEQYGRLVVNWPDHPRVPDVLMKLAAVSEAAGRTEEAMHTWQELPEAAPQKGEARFLVAVALSRLGRFAEARQAFAEFLGKHPSHPRFLAAQEGIPAAWIDEGHRQLGRKDPERAAAAWRAFLAAYPVHARAPEVERALGELLLGEGQAAEALAAWRTVAERYPRTTHGAEALARVAQVLEAQGDLAGAVRTLEDLVARFRGQPVASQGAQRLLQMRQKELRLDTPRARTVAQGAALRLVTRNIARLELKAWKVDLVEYFRKKHQVGAVERVAVDVVKPDAAWTVETPAYEPFRRVERDLALEPLSGPGAWIVLAEEDDWRAQTLVVVSDLTTVVKRAAGQVLVLAIDERTGAPAPGVEVLVSDGSRVVQSGQTGPDGVASLEGDDLPAGQTRVLAFRQGSVAFDDGGSGGVGGGFGYSPKAWVFTDRPVYRPGGLARWKAVVRAVDGAGSYALPGAAEARVTVLDARGVRLIDETRRTSAWGALEGELELGEDAPLGDYTVQVECAGAAGQATFAVEAYKKPEVLVDVSTAQRDVLTGEEVQATITARTYYGGVVADAPVTWIVWRRPAPFDREAHKGFAWFLDATRGDDEERAPPVQVAKGEGRTDRDGRLPIAFATEPLDEDMTYTVDVVTQGLDRRPVRGALDVPVSTRGFHAIVSAEARVVRVGKPLTVLIETVDARHQGVAAKGSLSVLSKDFGHGGGQPNQEVATDQGGQGLATVRFEEPGEYELTFLANDRRGIGVIGKTVVLVEGEVGGRDPRAGVRADREVYKRGDTARVHVEVPEAGRPALFTVEGERVLAYRVLRPQARSEALELKLEDAFAPNVFLRVAAPFDGTLHEAEDQVLVFKYLDLTVRPSKTDAGPGDEVVLEVEARDHAGAPVEAEVAVAVVDEAIFAIAPDRTPSAKPFFYDQRRAHGVGTGSSIDWSYAGLTSAQRRELQAEREEREHLEDSVSELENRIESLRGRSSGAPRSAPPAPPPPPGAVPAPSEEAYDSPMALEPLADAAGSGGGGGAGRAANAAPEPPRRRFADTALWAPSVVTGKDGKGRVTLRLPDDLTTWRVTARGATRETLVGDARAQVRTSKPLVVTLALPRAVTERDAFTVSGIVDNRTGVEQKDVEVQVDVDRVIGALREVSLATGAAVRVDAPARLASGRRTARARAVAGTQQDAIERPLPVAAVGLPEQRAESGALGARRVVTFDLPADRVRGTAALVVRVSPDGAAALLDGLDSLEAFPYGCVEQTVSRFLPLVGARELLLQSGLPADAAAARVALGVRRGVRRLVDLQRPDGGFGWWKDDPSSAHLTAYALLGLVRAREQGAFVDDAVVSRAQAAATRLLRAAGQDHDARALLVHALFAATRDTRALQDDLNRLSRATQELTTQALALLTLVRAQAREGDLTALVAALKQRAPLTSDGAPAFGAGATRRAWTGGRAEATAWLGLALLAAAPQDALVDQVAAFLRERQRADGGWRSTKETAAALLFLAGHAARTRGAVVDRTLEVTLNGASLLSTRVRGALGPAERTLVIGDDRLKDGRNELVLAGEGTGDVRFQARLTWLARSEALPAAGEVLRVSRALHPWNDPGAVSIVRGAPGADAPLERLAVGQRAWLRVSLEAREALPFALAEVPLPGGVEVVDATASGGRCDRVEVRDDRLALFFSELPQGGAQVQVLVQAVTPGLFLLLPARAELMYEPEVHGRSAGAWLEVTAEPAPSAPTPYERLLAARRHLAADDTAAARPLLEGLLALDLVHDVKHEVLLGLLRCGLRGGDQGLAVRSWEALRDLDPRRAEGALELAERRDLARAYLEAGEAQRAYGLLLDVLHLLFAEEAALCEAHRALGRPARAQEALSRTLRDYPDTDPIVQAWFRLACAWVEVPRPAAGPRPKHWKPEGPSTDVMLEEAFLALRDFCAWFPTSPLAPQAQLRAVEVLERLRDDPGVADAALAFAQRYPEDALLDDALIKRLRALVRLRRWDPAFECGRQLLAWRERRGRELVPSPFSDEVTHAFARMHHEKGELKQAVALYAQVAGRIPDARDAHAHLTAADLALPEVVRCAPGEEVALPLRSKNVASFSFRVYPVDLVVLFLSRMSLEGIHAVDLTGIAPLLERSVPLGAADDHRWREARVPLPVREPGTYLVVGKAGELDRSALVVVSELEVEVQRAERRVRVYVSTRGGAPAAGVRVRLTDGQRLVARGTTDGRGVFEGEAVVPRGRLSVVAERGGHVALLRE